MKPGKKENIIQFLKIYFYFVIYNTYLGIYSCKKRQN